jgi:ribosomal protein L44E
MSKKLKYADISDVEEINEDNSITRKQKSKQADTNVQAVPQEEKEYRDFKVGILHLTCTRCGNDEIIDKNIKGGISFILPTTDKHEVELKCGKCGTSLKLYYTENVEASLLAIQEELENKDKIEENDSETESES